MIPLNLRRLLAVDDSVFRAVLTLCQLYRVIHFKGELKTQTITDAIRPGSLERLELQELQNALVDLNSAKYRFDITQRRATLKFILSAGPNHSVSVRGTGWDAVAFMNSGYLLRQYLWLSLMIPQGFVLSTLLVVTGIMTCLILPVLRLLGYDQKFILGKLSIKEEAAGKRRVFAITDYWTQCLLDPVHRDIFDFLRTVPQDGTHDQNAPLQLLRSMNKNERTYSFDLSAATDRLPVSLQEQVMGLLYGKCFAKAWRILLTHRDWYLKRRPLRYAVGQPMGALSSWAMLALTHHIIVRVAALRVGKPNFTAYSVLGDDIVIKDKDVAIAYHALVLSLGLDISLHKSLISDFGMMEFAKRLVGPDKELTPIGGTLLVLASRNWKYLPTLLADLINKEGPFHTTEQVFIALAKMKSNHVKSHFEQLCVLLLGPGGLINDLWTSTLKRKGVIWTNLLITKPGLTDQFVQCAPLVIFDEWQRYADNLNHMVGNFSLVNQPVVRFDKNRPRVSSRALAWVRYFVIEKVLYIPNILISVIEKDILRFKRPRFYRSLWTHLDHMVQLMSLGPYLTTHYINDAIEKSQSYETVGALSQYLLDNPQVHFTLKLERVFETESFIPGFVPEVEQKVNTVLSRYNATIDKVKLTFYADSFYSSNSSSS